MKAKSSREALRWKTRFSQTKNTALILDALRKSDNRTLKRELIPYLLNQNRSRALIIPNPFPRRLVDAVMLPVFSTASLKEELWWAGEILRHHHPDIRKYLEFKFKIESKVCSGYFSEAETILEELEYEIGHSLWSHEMRIYLLGIGRGLDAQKEYCRSVKMDSEAHEILKCFTHYVSLRCEPRVSWWKYNDYVDDLLMEAESLTSEAGLYVRLLLNPLNAHLSNNPARALAILSAYPLIDYYEYFILVCQKLLAFGRLGTKDVMASQIQRLERHLDDERLSLLSLALDLKQDNSTLPWEEAINSALNYYTEGNYYRCSQLCKEIIPLYPENFSFYELYAKSQARTSASEDSPTGIAEIDVLLADLQHILLKTPHVEKSVSSLTKRAYNLSTSSFSKQLWGFLVREYITDGNPEQPGVLFGHLNGCYCNPRNAFIPRSPEMRAIYLERLKARSPHSPVLEFIRQITNNEEIPENGTVEPSRLKLYSAQHESHRGNFTQAEHIYRSLLEAKDYLLHQDALLKLNNLLFLQGKFYGSANLLCDAYLSNPHVEPRLPISETLDAIDKLAEPEIDKISVVILRELVARSGQANLAHKRDDSYEDYLYANRVTKPSELKSSANSDVQRSLIHFLRFVCVPEVMDSSVAFNTTDELLNERIGVCRLLIQIEPENIEIHSEEIKKITQQLIVQRGLREVEKSKIHVDISGIARSIEKSLRESYGRYVDLISSTDKDDEVENIILTIGENNGGQLVLFLPGDESRSLLLDMIREIRDQFVSSNEYGLDGYLSTGLRHGTLAGQIRSAFEAGHLVTQRDEDSLVYRAPTFWLDALTKLTEEEGKELSDGLQEFSKRIDDLIDEVRTEWIQIRTEKSPRPGLFDFRIPTSVLTELQNSIRASTSYDEFIQLSFEELWKLTDRNLNAVRRKIIEDLNPKVLSLVDNLSARLARLDGDISLLESALTTAKTQTQYSLDKIASWFRRTKMSDIGSYNFDLPLEIAIAMIRNVFPSYLFKCNQTIDSDQKLKGITLTSFVNAFYLLLENTRKHCGNEDAAVEIEATFTSKEEQIHIKISNMIKDEILLNDARQKLAIALEKVSGDSFEYVPKEGGSGFNKLKKILRVELQTYPQMRFEISDERVYSATVEFNSRHLFA